MTRLISIVLVLTASSAGALLGARNPLPTPAQTATDWCRTKTEDQLRDVRADLGGVRVSFQTSPTRGHYLFTPTYPTFDAKTRAMIRAEYKSRGYTHFPIGAIWERGYPGWPGHDFRDRPEVWVALLEELWRDDLIPMVWVLPDGPYNVKDAPGGRDNPPSLVKIEAGLTPIYARADVQRVTCMAVLGWEVTDRDWINTVERATEGLAWQARVFPRAYRYWHAAADSDAPCSAATDGEGCGREAWRAMAPYLHGEFWQTGTAGGWNMPGRDRNAPEDRVAAFLERLRREVGRFRGDDYVEGGVRGADGKPLDVLAGEYSAYFELTDGMSEAWGREWGRLAMTVPGVRGFGDGGPS